MSTSSTLVIRHISELCTCDPERSPMPGVISDAALIATDGLITFVGPEAELDRATAPHDAVEIDAGGSAVLPGFVDAHTHLMWLGDRGAEYAARSAGRTYEEIAAEGGGIRSTIRATAPATVDELADAARSRARRMLRAGTTTVEVKSGYGLAHEAEMRELDAAVRLRSDGDVPDVVLTYLPLHAAPDGDRGAYIDDVCLRGVSDASSRASFADAFCEQGAYTVDECERFLRAASARGLRPKLHAEQFSRTGAALLAARSGAVSADHLEHATTGDLSALAASGTVAVLLPGAALVLGGPSPPGRRAIEAGCTVALATDCNPGTCYCESLPLVMSLAVATAGLTPTEALVAATSGGAAALGLTDRGVLRSGRRCDAVILDSPHWIDVAYHLGGEVVRSVVLGGRVS